MKALVICPDRRPETAFLARKSPLALVRVLGPSLLSLWLTHLADRGAKRVIILASDRPDQVRAVVGYGERWGLKIELSAEPAELTVDQARTRFQTSREGWLPGPDDIVVADHLPGLPERPLFQSHGAFFAALNIWLPRAGSHRVGAHETSPGVWTGLHCRIEPGARLVPPCWIGDNAWIRDGAIVGPNAYIENSAMIDHHAEVVGSWIGPATYVGALTLVKGSLAWADGLLNHENGSFAEITDAFLLSNLRGEQGFDRGSPWYGRLAAALLAVCTLPVLLFAWGRNRGSGRPLFERRRAVVPTAVPGQQNFRELSYSVLNGCTGLARRWPQLWSVARGEFAWVGNRPLTAEQAAELHTEFEQLWLAAPIGLVALADTFSPADEFDDDARVHSSFYAVHADNRMRTRILRSLLLRTFQRSRQPLQ